jgi:hypothetical protein
MAINRATLEAYLEDALGEKETAEVEQTLRQSEPLRKQLRALMQERDRGEHSISAIWRRERLSCPSRDQLGSYLLKAVDPAVSEYIQFHLNVISCSFCQANLADLQAKQEEEPRSQQRRRRIFESSAGLLKAGRNRS